MIGFLPLAVQGIIRAVPMVTTRVVTSPAFITGVTAAAASATVTVVRKSGEDTAAQRAAENAHKEYDPHAWSTDPRTVRGFGQRVSRNVSNLGAGLAEEARGYRWFLAPPCHFVVLRQMRHDERKLAKLEKLFPKEGDPSLEVLAKYTKAKEKAAKHTRRYDRVKGWYKVHKDSKGEEYLNSVLQDLITKANRGGAPASPAAAYEKMLDQFLNNPNALKGMGGFNAGGFIYSQLADHFLEETELAFVHDKYLRGWLMKKGFNERQIREIFKGYARVQRQDADKRRTATKTTEPPHQDSSSGSTAMGEPVTTS